MTRPRLTGPRRVAERRRENVDIFLGLLGFFTVLLVISTVSAEVKGEPALARAVALAVMVALIYATWRIRSELDRKTRTPQADEGAGG